MNRELKGGETVRNIYFDGGIRFAQSGGDLTPLEKVVWVITFSDAKYHEVHAQEFKVRDKVVCDTNIFPVFGIPTETCCSDEHHSIMLLQHARADSKTSNSMLRFNFARTALQKVVKKRS